jgi:hypothetical protein
MKAKPKPTASISCLPLECSLRSLLKNCLRLVFLAVAFPMALLSGFGRLYPLFTFRAQACAPGECWQDGRIRFEWFFTHREARVAREVAAIPRGFVAEGNRARVTPVPVIDESQRGQA